MKFEKYQNKLFAKKPDFLFKPAQDQIEQKVAENVIYWLKKSMENCKESFHKLPASSSIRFLNDNCKINLSGSMSEVEGH